MDDTRAVCPERDRLERLTELHLTELADLARKEAEIVKTGDQEVMLAVDRRIELKIGEKERALGALSNHRAEHGC